MNNRRRLFGSSITTAFQQPPQGPNDPVENYRHTNIVSNPFPYVETGEWDDPGDATIKGIRHIESQSNNELFTHEFDQCSPVGNGPQLLEVGDLYGTSLDAFSRSSGGAVYHPRRSVHRADQNVVEYSDVLKPSAVLSLISNIQDTADPDFFSWGEPKDDDLDRLVAVTPISEESESGLGRDDTEEGELLPEDPSPQQPTDDGEPKCPEPGHDGCIRYASGFVFNDAFDDPSEDLDPYIHPEIPERNIDRDEAEDEAGGDWRLTLCGRSHRPFPNTRVNTGLGVGFFGATKYNPDNPNEDVIDEGSPVSYLRMVCAPWSSVPFVINWPFLRSVGTSYQGGGSNTTGVFPGRFGRFSTLNETLASVGEFRHDSEADDPYLRPVSMKTCPPNYLLTGVEFHARPHPDGNERILGGITTLICRKSPDAPAGVPDEVERDLYLPKGDPCKYKMGDRCFSFSQFIGWPRVPDNIDECRATSPPDACVERTECPSGTTAKGFAYQRSGVHIGQFVLNCIEKPGL